MPELPEVEIVRRGLASHIVGATCTDVNVIDERILRRHGAAAAPHPSGTEFAHRLQGQRIATVQRRGNFVWMPLVSDAASPQLPDVALTAHLGMSGQLLLSEPWTASIQPAAFGTLPRPRTESQDGRSSPVALAVANPHLRARMEFVHADGRPIELSFVDQRIFGRLAVEALVHDALDRLVPSSVASIAPDPLEPAFDEDAVIAHMRRSRATVKALLLDQRLVSGVGNIYADESLWRARLYWARPGQSIAARTLRRLLASVREVFAESLAQGGTTLDSLYVNVNGESGRFLRSLNAYGRTGKPCPRCGTTIRRERFGSRSSYYCPRCQRR